ASGTGSNHVLVAQSVGHAKTRLDVAPLDVRVMVWNAAEQAAEIELIRVRLGDAALRRSRKCFAGNNHAVVKIFVVPLPLTRPFLSIVPKMRPVVRSIVTALLGS